VKPGVALEHLSWAGKYAAYKKPEVIVNIGDFADMSSLSSYDIGKKEFEGRTYKADIDVARKAMKLFMDPIQKEMAKTKWKPRLVLTLGNHENRINRAISLDRKLEGLISIADLSYEAAGYEVYPFLAPVSIGGINFCHYWTTGVKGNAASTARAILAKYHDSCFAGHLQGRDIAYGKRASGESITAIISGSFYQHDEEYLHPQGNTHWRGIWMLHNVTNGSFDEMPISLEYLRSKYGTKK
jgi:hypothetical protein